MKLFFDTEFTGLHKNTTLISIGVVTEDDYTFYADFTDYDRKQVEEDEYVRDNIIPNTKYLSLTNRPALVLHRADRGFSPVDGKCSLSLCGDKEYIGPIFRRWMKAFVTGDEKIEFVSDVCHYDMVLLVDIFGGAKDFPEFASPCCHDINQDIAKHYNISEAEAFDCNREDIAGIEDTEGEKHNSLFDAKVIKMIYESFVENK